MLFSVVPRNASCGMVTTPIEIAGFLLRPIQHHARRSNLGQATDLQFLPRLLFFQNVAGLRVGNKVRLRRCRRANNGRARKKC